MIQGTFIKRTIASVTVVFMPSAKVQKFPAEVEELNSMATCVDERGVLIALKWLDKGLPATADEYWLAAIDVVLRRWDGPGC